jgi:hypothetical protein
MKPLFTSKKKLSAAGRKKIIHLEFCTQNVKFRNLAIIEAILPFSGLI